MYIQVYAHELALDGTKAATHTFTVVAKIIRYELRDLEDEDREAYFDALHQFYTLGQSEGETLYGPMYKSISFLVSVLNTRELTKKEPRRMSVSPCVC